MMTHYVLHGLLFLSIYFVFVVLLNEEEQLVLLIGFNFLKCDKKEQQFTDYLCVYSHKNCIHKQAYNKFSIPNSINSFNMHKRKNRTFLVMNTKMDFI